MPRWLLGGIVPACVAVLWELLSRAGVLSEDGFSRPEVLASAVRQATAAAHGEAFEKVVYVGDQPWDLRAAREVGVSFLGIGSDARRHHFEREGARVVGGYLDADLFLSALDDVVAESR